MQSSVDIIESDTLISFAFTILQYLYAVLGTNGLHIYASETNNFHLSYLSV